ncbi:hypothetical protein B0T26DRAFT_639862 [Lasiosphaeria miniovina]|uniref:Uncharacterized protein n=1 Tax=Lasiosphaeria miniovina TaxID=1954250 RepID=A0AA40E8D4_9PEZI|nr:uncharacterized protein B0T26DRAFT_639862 [Lasiosphaeria miniovina]KAK0728857.1 hypothetical protein B0T26DRAFT_639862 [Lasiosphaeria miniovina]
MYTALILSLSAAVAMALDGHRPCGLKIAPCPSAQRCQALDPTCTLGVNCLGYCTVTSTSTARPRASTYAPCGGFRITQECPCKDQICIDDPRSQGCGMACDAPGICVTPVFCGGFIGRACLDGKRCIDDPRDDCDPKHGGADCGGICV